MKIDKSWYTKPNKNFPERQAAGGLIIRRVNNSVLIGLIRDKKYAEYMIPKGGVEDGESPEEAAKREISEETGINKLKLVCYLDKKERLSFEKDRWGITNYFLFTTDQIRGEQNLQDSEEDLIFEWFDINKIPVLLWPEQKELIENNLQKIKSSI